MKTYITALEYNMSIFSIVTFITFFLLFLMKKVKIDYIKILIFWSFFSLSISAILITAPIQHCDRIFGRESISSGSLVNCQDGNEGYLLFMLSIFSSLTLYFYMNNKQRREKSLDSNN